VCGNRVVDEGLKENNGQFIDVDCPLFYTLLIGINLWGGYSVAVASPVCSVSVVAVVSIVSMVSTDSTTSTLSLWKQGRGEGNLAQAKRLTSHNAASTTVSAAKEIVHFFHMGIPFLA